jgi:hypothetical protein
MKYLFLGTLILSIGYYGGLVAGYSIGKTGGELNGMYQWKAVTKDYSAVYPSAQKRTKPKRTSPSHGVR